MRKHGELKKKRKKKKKTIYFEFVVKWLYTFDIANIQKCLGALTIFTRIS
jgi:hypothetical protein